MLEVWIKIVGNKPIDLDSPLYAEINDTVSYYFAKFAGAPKDMSQIERLMIPQIYVYERFIATRESRAKEFYRFVLRNRLARLIRFYVNIQYLINLGGVQESAKLYSVGQESTANYWRNILVGGNLPKPLHADAKPWRIRLYLRRKIRKMARAISQTRYLKIDFSTSDLTALVTVSGGMLIVLGYLRVSIIQSYFGVPYSRYFGVSDYVANSIDAIDMYLITGISTVILGILHAATASSAFRAKELLPTTGDRIGILVLHFTALAAFVILVLGYIQENQIDITAFLFISLYLGAAAISYLSIHFFRNPIKSFVFISLAYVAAVNVIAGSIREIRHLSSPQKADQVSVLRFGEALYSEAEWAILAITTDFVILRRYSDGLLRIIPKSALTRIDALN